MLLLRTCCGLYAGGGVSGPKPKGLLGPPLAAAGALGAGDSAWLTAAVLAGLGSPPDDMLGESGEPPVGM